MRKAGGTGTDLAFGVAVVGSANVIAIDSSHYGRVEDTHMGICHMLCDAFMENPEFGRL